MVNMAKVRGVLLNLLKKLGRREKNPRDILAGAKAIHD
jgi:hypothetical protein